MNILSSRSRAGFTLLELLFAMAATASIGGIVYTVLNAGMILFAKNSAINVAHQQARVTVLQMENDLHSAVSLPQLVDANRNPVETGPAAGISFQLFAGGAFKVTKPTAVGANTIEIACGSFTPKVGQRLCIPTHLVELDIIGVAPGCTLTVASGVPTAIETTLIDDSGVAKPATVMCFITDRVAYVVQGTELRFYGRAGNLTYTVMANNITSAAPFSIPKTPAGAPYYRFVSAINLSTADMTVSNRGFKAANMFLSSMVPARARLCTYQ